MNLFPKQRLRDTESILTVTKKERRGGERNEEARIDICTLCMTWVTSKVLLDSAGNSIMQ